MIWTTIAIIIVFTIGGSFIQRVSGFGFGVFIMTVLPLLMPSFGEATALSGMLAIFTALIPAISKRRYFPWRKDLPIMITFLIVSFFAVRLVSSVDSHLLKKVLGGVLVLVSIYFFLLSDKIRLKPTIGAQIGMGTLSGMMGGLFAMQGPPAVIYFIASCDRKDEYIAATQWYFLIGNFVMTLYRAGSGFVTPIVMKSWCCAVPAVLLGLWLGTKVYDKIRIEVLRKVVYAFLAVAGVVALV